MKSTKNLPGQKPSSRNRLLFENNVKNIARVVRSYIQNHWTLPLTLQPNGTVLQFSSQPFGGIPLQRDRSNCLSSRYPALNECKSNNIFLLNWIQTLSSVKIKHLFGKDLYNFRTLVFRHSLNQLLESYEIAIIATIECLAQTIRFMGWRLSPTQIRVVFDVINT